MTTKEAYKIPESLDKSFGDMEIAIQAASGVGTRPVSVKVILGVAVSAMLCFWICSNTFVKAGGVLIVLFVILWVILSLILLRPTKTGQLYLQLIPVMLTYIQKKNRKVNTLKTSNVGEFYSVVGIKSIDPESGFIEFADGTYGFAYRVVGSASVLLFESDRDAIIERVSAFYRNMDVNYELIFITVKEAQNVRWPLANLKTRFADLDVKDRELCELFEMQQGYLRNFVGREFKSIHQYLIMKADNKEALQGAYSRLDGEVHNSTLFIKQCTALKGDDIADLLRSIYTGKDVES